MRVDEKRVFLAGATGVIGRTLCRMLIQAGYTVTGTTRAADKTAMLESLGVSPVIVDVFDSETLRRAVVESGASVVIHQLTDLPPGLDPRLMSEARVRNARVRELGTKHLVEAAVAGKVERVVAQSIAFAYAPGPKPHDENAPLDLNASDPGLARSARAVASLEHQVLAGPFCGIVLRYGRLYGPGTGFDQRSASGAPVHVDAAADAALRALKCGNQGIYNIAEEDGQVTSAKARRELGWEP